MNQAIAKIAKGVPIIAAVLLIMWATFQVGTHLGAPELYVLGGIGLYPLWIIYKTLRDRRFFGRLVEFAEDVKQETGKYPEEYIFFAVCNAITPLSLCPGLFESNIQYSYPSSWDGMGQRERPRIIFSNLVCMTESLFGFAFCHEYVDGKVVTRIQKRD